VRSEIAQGLSKSLVYSLRGLIKVKPFTIYILFQGWPPACKVSDCQSSIIMLKNQLLYLFKMPLLSGNLRQHVRVLSFFAQVESLQLHHFLL